VFEKRCHAVGRPAKYNIIFGADFLEIAASDKHWPAIEVDLPCLLGSF
jgi:hypothetical protein